MSITGNASQADGLGRELATQLLVAGAANLLGSSRSDNRTSEEDPSSRHHPFVSAGPGDPELLTVRATILLGAADAVVADSDVIDIATRYAPDAELVSVVDDDGLPLDNAARAKRVVERARAGDNVARLYRAIRFDGSIATEAAVLNRSKLLFEVAPGVSQVSGVAALRGIPLMGSKAREVRMLRLIPVEDWAELASPRFTVVIPDGADKAVEIAKALIAAGRKGGIRRSRSPEVPPRSSSARLRARSRNSRRPSSWRSRRVPHRRHR